MSILPFPPVPIWAVQILLLGDLARKPEGKIKKLIARESITVRMYGPLNVDYEKIYVFENSERQQKEEPLKVELTLSNTEATGLGIPLPAGKIDMYTFFNGTSRLKCII